MTKDLTLYEVLQKIPSVDVLKVLTPDNFKPTNTGYGMIEFKSEVIARTKEGLEVILQALLYIHKGTLEALGQSEALRLIEMPDCFRIKM